MLKHHWGKKKPHNTLWYETLKMYAKNCTTENFPIFFAPKNKDWDKSTAERAESHLAFVNKKSEYG